MTLLVFKACLSIERDRSIIRDLGIMVKCRGNCTHKFVRGKNRVTGNKPSGMEREHHSLAVKGSQGGLPMVSFTLSGLPTKWQ